MFFDLNLACSAPDIFMSRFNNDESLCLCTRTV